MITGTGLAPGAVLTATADGTGTSESGPCVTTGPGVDLAVTQAVAPGGKVVAGEPIDVVIHIANHGQVEATNILLTDTLPSDSTLVSQPSGCPPAAGGQFRCSLGDLAPGAGLDVHILLAPGNVTTLTNGVEVDSDQVQENAGDNVSAFATAVTANPNAPGPPGPIDQPKPSFGQFIRLDRLSGSVTATLPNGQVIQLKNFALVPVGTQVQATAGVARVTAALPGRTARTSYADFDSGQFKIEQTRTKGGLVNAKLNGSLAGCSARQLRTSRDAQTASAVRRRPRSRHLWGHAHGRFTMQGDRGAATVRGTIWEVRDTCTTTIVVVRQGVVDVAGFGHTTPRHATVRAGHRVVLRAG